MNTTKLITECSRLGIVLTPALDFDGPDEVLSDGVEQQLRDQKHEVIRELIGPATVEPRHAPTAPDWRFEWLREMGMLALRWRDASDPDIKALLRELLAETPRTLTEWLRLGDMICGAEVDLRRAGKLPPIPNFDP
jgi:hypothetical protein